MLIIFGGLPATGKTTIARLVAMELKATYLRVDRLEQALITTGLTQSGQDIGAAGYEITYALAFDNLSLGLNVIADSVNPLEITRSAWRKVAKLAGVPHLEVELLCTDRKEHQLRAESRSSDIPDLVLPSWGQIMDREYEFWSGKHLVLDTANLNARQAADIIIADVHAALDA